MKKWIPVILSALLLAGCGASAQDNLGYRQITMEEAAKRMEQEPAAIILDVRRPDEYQAGHIPGAINIPNETIGREELPQLPDKDQTILVYCRSGNRSKQASEKLAALGYTQVLEFGGILDWTGQVVTEGA